MHRIAACGVGLTRFCGLFVVTLEGGKSPSIRNESCTSRQGFPGTPPPLRY